MKYLTRKGLIAAALMALSCAASPGRSLDAGPLVVLPARAGCITDNDCPPSVSECMENACLEGACFSANVPVGNACSENGGRVCDGRGGCVECLSPSDCSEQPCWLSTCVDHSCGVLPLSAGTACSDNGHVCDGSGKCVACLADSDCPVTSDCFRPGCFEHLCARTPLPTGQRCADGARVCDDLQQCVQCISNSDCLSVDLDAGGPFSQPCLVNRCHAEQCMSENAPRGTSCFVPVWGSFVCDGDGGCDLYSCEDGVTDFSETDLDCGGSNCDPLGLTCSGGQRCQGNDDCQSRTCLDGGICAAPICGDGVIQIPDGEQCDDGPGNGTHGDPCSANCQLTRGHYLTEMEPNDTLATGNPVDGYDGVIGRISPGKDVDWFPFNVAMPDSTIDLCVSDAEGNCPPGSFSSLRLGLDDSQGQIIATDGGCPTLPLQRYPAGEYAFVLTGDMTPYVPYYLLSFHVSSPGCGDGIVDPGEQCDPPQPDAGCSSTCQFTADYIPETEPNDTVGMANPLATHAGFVASIEPMGDVDFFSFDLPGPASSVTIQITNGQGECLPEFRSTLNVYGPDQQSLSSDGCTPITASHESQATWYARVSYLANTSTQSEYVLAITVMP